MTGIFLGVGSSINPRKHIPSGLRRLNSVAPIAACSRFYRTPAIGRPGHPDFVNGVVRIKTALAPHDLHKQLHRIEALEGRIRTPDSYAPRTFDLDILLYNDLRLDEGGLVIPNPDLGARRFLAVALLEIDPLVRFPDGQQIRDPGGAPLMEERGLGLQELLAGHT